MSDDTHNYTSLFGKTNRIPSPYLNFDPNLITRSSGNDTSEFIFTDGTTSHQRGAFELSFSQIGFSYLTGSILGSLYGFYSGIKTIGKNLENETVTGKKSLFTNKVIRSQLINHITKTGGSTASTFGVITVVYSLINVGISFINDSNQDLNKVIAATATGSLFRGFSTIKADQRPKINSKIYVMRFKKGLVGGLIGLMLSTTYVLLTEKDKYKL